MKSMSEKNNEILFKFGSQGWILVESLIDLKLLELVHTTMNQRRDIQQQKFETWVGSPIDGRNSYARHQQNISKYDKQDIPLDFRNFLVGQLDLETRLDIQIVSLLATDPIKKYITTFLESNFFYIHYPPMIRFKLADAPTSQVPIHQDFAYNPHISRFITVWLPLVDIDDECGGVIVYEGSHLSEVLDHKDGGAWANRAVGDTSEYPKRHIHMKAGDLLLFPGTLLHESAPHKSSKIRYSIDFRVFSETHETKKSFFDPFNNVIVRRH